MATAAPSTTDVWSAVVAGSRRFRDDLPRWVPVSVVLTLSVVVPFAGWAVAPALGLACLPVPLLVATGVARAIATVLDGGRLRLRSLLRHLDPATGLSLAVAPALGLALVGTGDAVLVLAGTVVLAVAVVLTPVVLGRVGVRDEPAGHRWRVAMLLIAARPAWAVTGLPLGVLAAFAVVATAGALALVLPAWWLMITVTLVDQASRSVRQELRGSRSRAAPGPASPDRRLES
jgi:hypothetical protein